MSGISGQQEEKITDICDQWRKEGPTLMVRWGENACYQWSLGAKKWLASVASGKQNGQHCQVEEKCLASVVRRRKKCPVLVVTGRKNTWYWRSTEGQMAAMGGLQQKIMPNIDGRVGGKWLASVFNRKKKMPSVGQGQIKIPSRKKMVAIGGQLS